MSSYGDENTFDGSGSLKASTFIRNVRQQALTKDRQDNDKWMAQTAAASLDGSALDWYEELDEEVQESWKLLRRAILTRWPTAPSIPIPSEPSSAAYVPTPAAAPSGGSSAVAAPALARPAPRQQAASGPPQARSRNAGPHVGRLRVELLHDDSVLGYLERYADKDGDYSTTTNLSEAMLVEFSVCDGVHGVKVLSNNLANEWLGIVLYDADSHTKITAGGGSATFFSMRLASSDDASSIVLSSPSSHSGKRRADVWTFLYDGTAQVHWKESETILTPMKFVAIVDRKSDEYGAVGVIAGYSPVYDAHSSLLDKGLRGARMIFEPL